MFLLVLSLAALLMLSASSAGAPAMPGSASLRAARYGLRAVALGYLAVILGAPLALVFWNTFEDGVGDGVGGRSRARRPSTRST